MEVIVSSPKSVTVVERIRAPQIYITNPWQEVGVHPLSEISFNSEKLQFIDGAVNTALPASPVIRRIVDVLGDSVTFTSPITGKEQTLFVAEFAEALAAFYCKWYAENEKTLAEKPIEAPADLKA